jgi:superfamily II DNA/RNA helicase
VDERRGQSKAHVKVAKSAAVTYAQLAVDCPEVLGHPTVSNANLDECLRLLMGELGNTSTIIYTRYAQVATAVHAALEQAGVKVALITGDVSASQRRTRQLAFQRGDVQVMVLTSSGREGLDLQTASCVIFYDLPWSHMEFTQVMGRARRIGSAHSRVTLLLLGTLTNHLAPTIDAMVLERLKRKSLIVEDVFGSTVLEAELKTASLMPVSDSVTDTDELNTTTAGTPPPVASATAADDSGASLVEGSDIDALFAALQAWGESPTA